MATPDSPPTDESWVEVPPRPVPQVEIAVEAPRRVPNARRTFWVLHAASGERRQITARLRTQTEHTAMWVEEGVWHDVRELQKAADVFDEEIYDELRDAFGSEWTPGIDGSPRISILHAAGLGQHVLGYTSSLDEYPSDVYPLSNEAEMITVNVERVDIGSRSYYALLAREFLSLIQWHQDRNEERWVREGLAELAAAFTGSETDVIRRAHLQHVDAPLTDWADTPNQRGAAYLLMAYFHQRFGDAGTRALTAEPADGVKGFDAALDGLETGLLFEDVFGDWLAALYLDSVPETDDPNYTYQDLDLRRPTASATYERYPVREETSVHQLATDYVVLRGEDNLRVQFSGQQQTPLLSRRASISGTAWWSNRADESLTSLTRRFDLRAIDEATLTYRVWYDIESHYDYATVEISDDGGERWHTLPLPSGTDANPRGNNPGWGYTGTSAGWIREALDISDYAGDEILLRFSYLTDGAVTGEGLLVDDVSIAELDQPEDAESETDAWQSRGFIFTDGLVPQSYVALLISRGKTVTVEKLSVQNDGSATWTVPLGSQDLQEAVLVLSAVAPFTHQPATYRLAISRVERTPLTQPDTSGD